jgi:Xaa-Pro dipeptidase
MPVNTAPVLLADQIKIGEGPLLEELFFPAEEYENRLSKLRGKMEEDGIDTVVSFSPENINYLTGHDTYAYQYLQACVIGKEGVPVNLLRSIDGTNTLYRSWNRAALIYGDSDDAVEFLAALIVHIANGRQRVGFEADPFFVGPSRYNRLVKMLEEQGISCVEQCFVEDMRLIKSAREIDIMRQGARASDAAMKAAVAMAAEGVSENDVAAKIWSVLIENGGEFAGLPPFIASGPRTSLGHATWSGRKFQKGDALAFEIPGVIARYATPLFRTGFVGEKSTELAQLEAATIRSLELLIENIKPGAVCEEIHQINADNFAAHGFTLGHRSGYSTGVNYAPDWGEGNILSIRPGEKRKIEEGMVFHLVPGIYVEGKHVVVISDTVVVTATGCERLTTYPREVFIV